MKTTRPLAAFFFGLATALVFSHATADAADPKVHIPIADEGTFNSTTSTEGLDCRGDGIACSVEGRTARITVSGSMSATYAVPDTTRWSVANPDGGADLAKLDTEGDLTLNGGVSVTTGAFSGDIVQSAATAGLRNSTASNPVEVQDDDGLTIRNDADNAAAPLTAGIINSTSTATSGCEDLVAGSTTETVTAGATCVCSNADDTTAVFCSVTDTTLTITGTDTDTVCWVCL